MKIAGGQKAVLFLLGVGIFLGGQMNRGMLPLARAQTPPARSEAPVPDMPQTPSGNAAAPAPADPESAGPAASPVMGSPAPAVNPKPIVIEKTTEEMKERLHRHITLDVREMNTLDVLKFLALKGNFNMVTGDDIAGRVTLYLKNVSIQDALDIVVISNALAYYTEHEIIYVMTSEEYQAMFGKKFNEKEEVEIVKLKYAKPSYVLAALDNIKSDLGRIIIDEDTGTVVMIDTAGSIREMQKVIDEIETPLEPFVYSLQYAKADVVAEKLKQRVDALAVGSIMADERANRLIVRAYPERRQEIEQMIRDLDTPTKEVLVEARVLQVAFKPKLDWGIDWQWDFRNSPYENLKRFSFSNMYLDENNLTSSNNLYSEYGKIGIGDFSTDSFEMAIRALKQVQDTKILSNPKLLVTNNEEAKIHVGDTVPYIISTTSGTGENAITSEDVRFVDVGLKLNVTPTINDDGFVTMTLKPEISEVVGSISSQGGGIPQVNKTLVETTVMVKDGSTIVLGGLRKENKTQTRKGVPVLMDIPILKALFSNTTDSIEATEIVIFITPHIIRGDENFDRYRGDIKPPKEYTQEGKFPDQQVLTIKE